MQSHPKGLVLGKFMPPHLGHVYLVDFAQRFTPNVHVVVGTMPNESIDGQLRYQWMKSLFPELKVHHLHKELPQQPSEHPDFWNIWKRELIGQVGDDIDYLFASEDYGEPLAKVLGARFIPVDKARSIRPISGTAVRKDPIENWHFLPNCVRAHYTKRICVFGPESTGKTTLAQKLANHFDTLWVPEYARTLLEGRDGEIEFKDLDLIAKGQAASEDALAPWSNRMIFLDTDTLATSIWSNFLFQKTSQNVATLAEARKSDLYLLTDVNVPFVEDLIRYFPEQRKEFFEACRAALIKHGQPFQIVNANNWDDRFSQAVEFIEQQKL